MAFSDARNERDRAETGHNSTNHGGGDWRDAQRRNVDAMASRNMVTGNVPRGFRRTANPTPSYDLSLHNLREMMGMMPLGPMSAVSSVMGALGVPGFAPDFQGYNGNVQGPGDYDPTNRFGTGEGLMARMSRRAGRGLQRTY